jgi:uncharacterized protein YdhG (YjbR/CyaY superfamily)
MEIFDEFLLKINDPEHHARTKEVLDWVMEKYPQLVPRIAWNQPMFTDHGTFIIAFSLAKQHLAVSPEQAGIMHFADEFEKEGLSYSNMLVRFPWNKPINLELISKMIEFNLEDKKDCQTFWRK